MRRRRHPFKENKGHHPPTIWLWKKEFGKILPHISHIRPKDTGQKQLGPIVIVFVGRDIGMGFLSIPPHPPFSLFLAHHWLMSPGGQKTTTDGARFANQTLMIAGKIAGSWLVGWADGKLLLKVEIVESFALYPDSNRLSRLWSDTKEPLLTPKGLRWGIRGGEKKKEEVAMQTRFDDIPAWFEIISFIWKIFRVGRNLRAVPEYNLKEKLPIF